MAPQVVQTAYVCTHSGSARKTLSRAASAKPRTASSSSSLTSAVRGAAVIRSNFGRAKSALAAAVRQAAGGLELTAGSAPAAAGRQAVGDVELTAELIGRWG